jgi:hypothetical protein
MPIILTLRRLKQEDHEIKASLGYIARLCPPKKQKHKQTTTKKKEDKDGF